MKESRGEVHHSCTQEPGWIRVLTGQLTNCTGVKCVGTLAFAKRPPWGIPRGGMPLFQILNFASLLSIIRVWMFSRSVIPKCPVCDDHRLNQLLAAASVLTTAKTKNSLRDKSWKDMYKKTIWAMDSYQETETYQGKNCTNLKSIDPLRCHDRTDGLEFGYMSSRVAERRSIFE